MQPEMGFWSSDLLREDTGQGSSELLSGSSGALQGRCSCPEWGQLISTWGLRCHCLGPAGMTQHPQLWAGGTTWSRGLGAELLPCKVERERGRSE